MWRSLGICDDSLPKTDLGHATQGVRDLGDAIDVIDELAKALKPPSPLTSTS
jgi:hypothetical protein